MYWNAPETCLICEDPRQWVPTSGQAWLSAAELAANHRNLLQDEDDDLLGLGIDPPFAISQRMLLVTSHSGNLLWDMIPLCTEDAVDEVARRGTPSVIAISHPHYCTGMLEWSAAMGDVPIMIHEENRPWVTRPDPRVHFWRGDTVSLFDGLSLIRLGGHFPGSAVLHWPNGAQGRGTLLSGDTLHVLPHCRSITAMWSYPNMIPLSAQTIRRIASVLRPLAFDRIWGAWWRRCIAFDAKRVVTESLDLYLARLAENGDASCDDHTPVRRI
jgi:glyoxylase-like metal-dependent hydrolase (beta-lactamase superfamily II)